MHFLEFQLLNAALCFFFIFGRKLNLTRAFEKNITDVLRFVRFEEAKPFQYIIVAFALNTQ
jgi:hypothetical protein